MKIGDKTTSEYYMVLDDEGDGYGGFETLQEAITSLNTHDEANNSTGKYNKIAKIVENLEIVYEKS